MQGDSEGAGGNVVCVPEFTFMKLMKPYDGFADVYDGQPATRRPIMFSDDGRAYDEIAAKGTTGYDPNLCRGLPVKPGQRVMVWLPILPSTQKCNPDVWYRWQFFWRARNLFDFRNAVTTRYNYSLPFAGPGQPDQGQTRVMIPAAIQSVIYNQNEPVSNTAPLVDHLRVEELQNLFYWPEDFYPLMPDGSEGAVQQGVILGTAPPTVGYRYAWFVLHEMQAMGDELLIGLYRETTPLAGGGDADDWDFSAGGVDDLLQQFLDGTVAELFCLVSRGLSP